MPSYAAREHAEANLEQRGFGVIRRFSEFETGAKTSKQAQGMTAVAADLCREVRACRPALQRRVGHGQEKVEFR